LNRQQLHAEARACIARARATGKSKWLRAAHYWLMCIKAVRDQEKSA
jgi:hypothetical protein